MSEHRKSPYLTPAEAAAYLRMEERTLNNMRWRGEGPRWRKHGSKVLYHIDWLDAYSSARGCGDGPNPPFTPPPSSGGGAHALRP